MSYSEWTLESVLPAFHLDVVDTAGLFSEIDVVDPTAHLVAALARKAPLATTIGTEKAKSEMIVADVLVDLLEHFDRSISLFSGIDFNVDSENGLTGVCDFLVSLSPRQSSLEAPVIIVVEAKKDDLLIGLGQCVAEMIAAQRFNAEKGNDIQCIYGSITSGIDWKFLKLEGNRLHIDMVIYTIERCDRILGILSSMVAQKA